MTRAKVSINNLTPKIAYIALSETRDGVIVTNLDNEIVFVNSSFSKVTGYSSDDIIGCNPRVISSGRHDKKFYIDMWNTLAQKGYWHGEIWDKRKNGEVYLEYLSLRAISNSDGKVENYLAVFTDINEKYVSEQELDRATRYDLLTALPNQNQTINFLKAQLSSSKKNCKLLAVVSLDIDDFKIINDNLGHDFGNRLLIVITKRLKRLIRSTDMVGRSGGDEFTLIFCNLDNYDQVEQMVSRILALIAMPIEIDGSKYQLTASIGFTLFPFDDADAELLLRHADQAMFSSKENGKNQYHLFDIAKDKQAQTRRELLQQLSIALKEDELFLVYQPKINMRTGEVLGAEALIRWQHPERGILSPGEFIPHAEHHQIIIEIGEWVLREVLAQITEWLALNLKLVISINIAAKQILQADFLSSLKVILNKFPEVPLDLLEMEILESAALENTKHVANMIEQCQEMGIDFSLDDFGTGYASLSYLRDIPADTLKIDQSFIFNLLDDSKALALVEGTIGLANAFHRKVIAEGIEEPEQGVLLMRLGCDLGQGYLIAKPMSADKIPDWVQKFKPYQIWSIWKDSQWNMDDFPLLVAQYDHVNWVKSIMMYLDGNSNSINRDNLINHHECRFGHWYYGPRMQCYQNIDNFKDIEPLHVLAHQYGHSIIELCDEGEFTKARELSVELLKLKDLILENLLELQNKLIPLQKYQS